MKRNGETGQALVVAALTLTVLMLAAGLAIDMGYLRYEKRLQQSAADAAAIAGAAEIPYDDGTGTQIKAAAIADAESNGFQIASVNVFWPPTHTLDIQHQTKSAVEVFVTQSQPTFFMRIAGINSATVSARAVALIGNGPSCMYALGPLGIVATGVALTVEAPSCAVMSNGDLNMEFAYLDNFVASAIGDASGACDGGCGPVSPAVQKIVPPADPLAYLPTQGNPGPCTMGPQVYANVTLTVPSGSYPCGIEIAGSGTVTLDGTYVLGGSGAPCPTYYSYGDFSNTTVGTSCSLAIIGTGTVQSGPHGVTLYNYSGSIEINPTASYSSCNNSPPPPPYVGGTVQLTAPTSGSYAGVLVMQDPSNTQTTTLTIGNGDSCSGSNPGPSSYMVGAIYVPQAELDVDGIGLDADAGCSTQPRFTTIDAYKIVISGNLNIGSNDCASPAIPVTSPLPDPVKAAVLVE